MTEPIRGWRTFIVGQYGEHVWLESHDQEPFDPARPAECREGSACYVMQQKLSRVPGANPEPPPHAADPYGGYPACGYYAHAGEPEMQGFTLGTFASISATVEGFGIVKEHSTGWRSQYMRVLKVMGTDKEKLQKIAERYECEWEEVCISESSSEQASESPIGTASAQLSQAPTAPPKLRVKKGFLLRRWHSAFPSVSRANYFVTECGLTGWLVEHEYRHEIDVTCKKCVALEDDND